MPLSWNWSDWIENMVYRNPAKTVSSWPRKGIVLAFVYELKMNVLPSEGNICCYANVPFILIYACVIISDFDVVNRNFWSGFVELKSSWNESLDISLDCPLGMKDWYDLGPDTVFVNS